MAIVRGLRDLNKIVDKSNDHDGESARWLKVKNGDSVKIRFMQELDPDSPNYNGKNGLGFIAVEHVNPKDYLKRALCTADDGVCFGCEQARQFPKTGWQAKKRLYINVLVDDGKEDPYVAIMSQGTGPKSATQEIIAYAVETDSITNVTWKLKRSGEGQSTEYSIIPLPTSKVDAIDAKYEVYDLEKTAVRELPYSEQKGFFLGEAEDEDTEETSSSSSSVEW